jgi:hypothetical protein
MNNPIKVIYKYKNAKTKIQYNVYIFLGNMANEDIKKILEKFKQLSLYDTLINLSKTDTDILIKHYDEYWYKKFFISSHILKSIESINTTDEKKKNIIKKYGQKWFDEHINNVTVLSYTTYSYSHIVKMEQIQKNKKELNLNQYGGTIIDQTGSGKYLNARQVLNRTIDNYYSKVKVDEEESIDKKVKQDLEDSYKESIESSIEDRELSEESNKTHSTNMEDVVEQVKESVKQAAVEEYLTLNTETPSENNSDNELELIGGTDDDDDDNDIIETTEDAPEEEEIEENNEIEDEDIEVEDYIVMEDSQLTGDTVNGEWSPIKFDTSKDNNLYDELLQNVYNKHYIYNDYIYWDDSIKKIKYKICGNIEKSPRFDKTNPYLLPSRIYLWSEYNLLINNKKKKESLMLGAKWIIRNQLLAIDIEPNNNIHVYEQAQGILKLLKENVKKYGSKIKWENNETNILDEYRDFINNDEIFMIDLYNELGTKYEIESDKLSNLYDVYIKIYFHELLNEDLNSVIAYLNKANDLESNKINSIYNGIKNLLILEREVINTVEDSYNNKNIYNKYFNQNFITQTDLLVNIKFNSIKLDLYKIFDNFIVNDIFPFIQYHTNDNKVINKFYDQIEISNKWFEVSQFGLNFKVKVNFKDTFRYLTIIINEYGRTEYKTQWKEDDNIIFEDIIKTNQNIINLLKKINNENISIKIEIPHEKEFRYAFINTIQQFYLPPNFIINHNDLSDFGRYFFPYISVVVDPRKRQSSTSGYINTKSKYGTYLRFKRISKYDNESRIENRIIYFLRNYEFIPHIIVELLTKQFNITDKVALEKIVMIKAKNPMLKKSRKVLKKLDNIPKYKPPGIGIDIQGKTRDSYKIRISGARSEYQLNQILNFIHVFMYLYIDTYLFKNKSRKNLISKLEKLTDIAKRKNLVQEIVAEPESVSGIKSITKLDKARVGFKPEKGQNQWSRSCQNSGDQIRRPIPFTSIENLEKNGYVLKNGVYFKKIMAKQENGKTKETMIRAIKLDDNYWTCNDYKNKEFVHIGFLSKSNNPNGLCMPCCFKKDQATSNNKYKKILFNKCLNNEELVKQNFSDQSSSSDKLYILQDNNKMVPNKFSFLSKYIDNLFNQLSNNNINIKKYYLVNTSGYFLKYRTEDTTYIGVIAYILNISVEELINNIKKKLNDQLFICLNNGDIKIQFITINKYLKFILDNKIDHELIDDLLCAIYNINTYILEVDSHSDEYYIICKNIENYVYLLDTNRPNIILIKDNNNYYPIFYIVKHQTLKIQKTFKYNDNDIINKLWKYLKLNCSSIIISEIVPTARFLGLSYKITAQYIDNKYKCKYVLIDNNLLLPVKPCGTIIGIEIKTDITNKLLPLKETFKKLLEFIKISKLDYYNPKGIIYEDDYIANGIKINEYLIIPVIKEKINKYELADGVSKVKLEKIPLFNEIDTEIIKGKDNIIYDDRMKAIDYDNYYEEGYELLRLEISELLTEKDIEEINKKNYDVISKIIKKEVKEIPMPNIKNLELKNIRTRCSIGNSTSADSSQNVQSVGEYNCNNIYCTKDKNKCKLSIPKNILEKYTNRLIEELKTNPIKRNEILKINGNYVSDIKNYDIFTSREHQKILAISNSNIKIIIENIFGKENVPIIGKRKLSKLEKHINEEKESYKLLRLGNLYYQVVINNNPMIRAYVNCYYWNINNYYSEEIKNLGYLNNIQTKLVNKFKSIIYDWLNIEENKIELIKYNSSINIDDYLDYYDTPSYVYEKGIVEMYVLNRIHNIEIIVYNQYDVILYQFPGNKEKMQILIKYIPGKITAIYKI